MLLLGAVWSAPARADATLDGLQVREPVVIGGLAVYLVVDPAARERPAGEHQLLGEALAAGTLKITEVDAGGDVPTLSAHNTGSVPVLAMAGDVIDGGKQDRVITQDMLIAPSRTPQPITVNCVERSRWSASGQGLGFSYGGKSEVALRKTVQVDKDQGQTWSKVSELNGLRGQAPATGTYRASLTDPGTGAAVDAGLAKLAEVQDAKGVGVVVAVRGDLETAELYDNPAIFARARSDLLRSLVLEAHGQGALTGVYVPPSAQTAADWVAQARRARVEQTTAQPASDYVEMDGVDTKSYELREKDGKRLKETIYKK
jgi:hypothetical protein